LLRPQYEKRISYCDSIADLHFVITYRLMTERIVYQYLNTIRFGMEEI